MASSKKSKEATVSKNPSSVKEVNSWISTISRGLKLIFGLVRSTKEL